MSKFTQLNILGFILFLVLWRMIVLKRHARSRGSWLPFALPQLDPVARGAETAVLLILSLGLEGVYFFTYMTHLERLAPAYVPVYLGFAGLALAGLAFAGVVAWKGRLRTAIIFAAAVLIVHGSYLNNVRYPPAAHNDRIKPERGLFEIRLTGGPKAVSYPVDGADLWVNGVYLGKTPVTLTRDEFKAKVPYWPQAPAEDKTTSVMKCTIYDSTSSNQVSLSSWIRIYIPADAVTQNSQTYYATARWEGSPGYAIGGRGYSGDGVTYKIYSEVVFPERESRLKRLFNRARLEDFHVNDQWWKALDSYGTHGETMLRRAAQEEAAFAKLLSARAHARFVEQNRLDAIRSPEQAWAFLEQTMEQADLEKMYTTDSPRGLQLERVARQLDPERLVKLAETMIPKYQRIEVGFRSRGDARDNFKVAQRIEKPNGSVYYPSDNDYDSVSAVGHGSKAFPPRSFVVAHAVWALNRHLVSLLPRQPTLIQQRIVPQILRWHFDNEVALKATRMLGGPEWMRFFTAPGLADECKFSSGCGDSIWE